MVSLVLHSWIDSQFRNLSHEPLLYLLMIIPEWTERQTCPHRLPAEICRGANAQYGVVRVHEAGVKSAGMIDERACGMCIWQMRTVKRNDSVPLQSEECNRVRVYDFLKAP